MPEGIVLTRTSLREFDEIISIITRERGRVDVVARGVKKITSKLSSHLEPLSRIIFDSVQGKEMVILKTVSPLQSYSKIRTHYIKSLQGEFAAHTLYRLTRPGNLDQGMFDLFSTWLGVLDTVDTVSDCRFLDWFVLKLMSEIGFYPRYAACAQCGRKEDLVYWSFAAGGTVCSLCANTARLQDDSLFRISSHVLADITRLDEAFPHELREAHSFDPGVHSLLLVHVQYQSEIAVGNWAHTCT